jgi:hypothetical protein
MHKELLPHNMTENESVRVGYAILPHSMTENESESG